MRAPEAYYLFIEQREETRQILVPGWLVRVEYLLKGDSHQRRPFVRFDIRKRSYQSHSPEWWRAPAADVAGVVEVIGMRMPSGAAHALRVM